MKMLGVVLLLSGSFLLAQDNNPSQHKAKESKGQGTVQGCASRSTGDYVLFKQDPGMTYELQTTGKIKLRRYLGQQVEVTGTEGPSMSTSSDTLGTRMGSPASVTITITSIKTIEKECPARQISQQ